MEDNTLETRDSGISDLSALDSTTDDFYKRGVDYLRRAGDESRMQPPSNGYVQPFRRARPVNKLALTMENLERNNAVSVNNGPPKESHQDASIQLYSTSGSDSTGSPNVPKQWGRKGRQRNEFLRRINSTSAATAPARERERDPDLIYPYRTGFTGDTSPRLRRTASTFERDPLAQRRSDKRNTIDYDTRNTTLDEIMELEKESAFVDNGSPTASKSERRKRSESITQKEIQSLRARAVTTSRLAEDGRTLRRPKSLADAFNQADATVDSILGDLNTSRNNPARHDNAYSQSLPDALKGRESTAPVADNPSPANAGSRTFDEEPPRSRSSELLRQLARASSTTPSSSPNSPRRRPPGIPQRTSSHRSRASQSSKSQNHASPGDMLGRDRPLTPKSTSSTDPRRRKLSEKTDSALVKTERGLRVAQESIRGSLSNNRLSDKPALKDSAIPKTPDIVGAWIDTPATQAGRYRLHHSASDGALSCRVGQQSRSSQAGHERQGAKYLDNPPYAKSVLEALLGDRSRKQGKHARPHKDEGPDAEPLNDETIASLQELAETDPSQAQSLLDIDDTTLDLIANVSTPLSSRKPTGRASLSYEAQRQEQLALQRMAKTLKNARHGLKDTSRRLQRVEHEVELEGTSRIPDAQIKKYGCCPYCGCPGAAGRSGPPVTTLERGKVQITRQVEQDTLLSFMLTLLWWVSLSRLYVRRKEDNRIRLTRTGWGLLIFVVWAVVEDMLWFVLGLSLLHIIYLAAGRRKAHVDLG